MILTRKVDSRESIFSNFESEQNQSKAEDLIGMNDLLF